jgi:hypothetical protein
VTAPDDYYTTQLQAGLGLVDETKTLLQLWQPDMDTRVLYQSALASGQFPNISARRLRNIVSECFAPRYLKQNQAARFLKPLVSHLNQAELSQLFLLYTCRAHSILADFITQVYWPKYSGGADTISNDDAREFVVQAIHGGKTQVHWSDSTVRRVASYLTGCCADYGLLAHNGHTIRKILPFRLQEKVSIFIAYDLHFAGRSDNSVLAHQDWQLFGLERIEVREQLKQMSLKGLLILQSVGDVTRISWRLKNRKEVIDVITES